MTEVHGTAARGFDIAAGVYERGRPSYPAEAVDALLDGLALPDGGRVLDLGAGTGKLTRLLVDRGVDCVAVEPVAGMREGFARAVPEVACLDGAAEAIPLPDASVDAVVVAQAFHWFRHGEALAEMHRVLRPGGRLGLIWNVRDERVPWVARVTAIIAPHEEEGGVKIPRHRQGAWRAALGATDLFAPVAETEVEHGQPMTPETLVERVLSTSFIAVLDDERKAVVVEQVRALTHEPPLADQERFVFPYVTEVSVYARS